MEVTMQRFALQVKRAFGTRKKLVSESSHAPGVWQRTYASNHTAENLSPTPM